MLDNKQQLTSILFIPKIFKLLVISFLIKLFARKDIFKVMPFLKWIVRLMNPVAYLWNLYLPPQLS